MVTTEKEPRGPEGSDGTWQNMHWDRPYEEACPCIKSKRTLKSSNRVLTRPGMHFVNIPLAAVWKTDLKSDSLSSMTTQQRG